MISVKNMNNDVKLEQLLEFEAALPCEEIFNIEYYLADGSREMI
jgi:hypothetical protein